MVAAVVAAAVVVGAVVVAAVVPEVAAVAAAALAAVCPGVVAAYAKHDTPTNLINAIGHGRVRQSRPGQSLSRLRRSSHARVGETANIGRTALRPFREMPARELDIRTPAAGEAIRSCVYRKPYPLITRRNHLSWRNDWAALFRFGRFSLAIQVAVAASG